MAGFLAKMKKMAPHKFTFAYLACANPHQMEGAKGERTGVRTLHDSPKLRAVHWAPATGRAGVIERPSASVCAGSAAVT